MEGNLSFLLCFTFYLRAISKYSPRGAYIWRGDLTEDLLRYELWGYLEGLIHGRAYFQNFAVSSFRCSQIQLFSLNIFIIIIFVSLCCCRRFGGKPESAVDWAEYYQLHLGVERIR